MRISKLLEELKANNLNPKTLCYLSILYNQDTYIDTNIYFWDYISFRGYRSYIFTIDNKIDIGVKYNQLNAMINILNYLNTKAV